MKKEEMMLKATQMLAKGKFKLKKAGPTIMIVGAAIGGVTAAVLACKATLKAEEIIAEHNAQVETIHATKAQVDSGEMQLKGKARVRPAAEFDRHGGAEKYRCRNGVPAEHRV